MPPIPWTLFNKSKRLLTSTTRTSLSSLCWRSLALSPESSEPRFECYGPTHTPLPWYKNLNSLSSRFSDKFPRQGGGGGSRHFEPPYTFPQLKNFSSNNPTGEKPSSDRSKQKGKVAEASKVCDEREFETVAEALLAQNPEILEPTEPDVEYSDKFFEEFQVDDDEIESLLTQRNLMGIEGLPPLEEILEYDPDAEAKQMRRDRKRMLQEEIDKQRVQKIDKKGRSYATGKRKTSIARVWLWPGQGRIAVNGRAYDEYQPDIRFRGMILEPFITTNTLGKFDVRCTVVGGGISGQVGAIRHGISKALQLYDPLLRPPLKSAGFLTRDSRVVERKKPGKAKARKSFQWVKR